MLPAWAATASAQTAPDRAGILRDISPSAGGVGILKGIPLRAGRLKGGRARRDGSEHAGFLYCRDMSNTGRSGCLRRLMTTVLVLIVAALVLRWAGPRILEAYGRWLVVEDPFEHADAAVALGGGDGERLVAAIQLYKSSRAASVLITGPNIPLLKVYTGEDSLTQGEAKRRIAIKRGVPADRVLLALGPTSTWQEAQRTRREAEANGWKSIVVVTDPFHTRRARATFHKVFGGSPIQVAVYHLPEGRSSQTTARWWRREGDFMAVINETLKLFFYAYEYRIRPWPDHDRSSA